MLVGGGGLSGSSWRQSIKVGARSRHTVEEVVLAIEEMSEHASVKSAARANSAKVLFLVRQANQLVRTGTNKTLSNVPQFTSDEFLSKEFSKHKKIVSLYKTCLDSCLDGKFS